MNLRETTLEVIYKPYSMDIHGYILRIADFLYIVINSRLSKQDADKAHDKLIELSASHSSKFVLLKGNGQVHKSEDLDFLERAC